MEPAERGIDAGRRRTVVTRFRAVATKAATQPPVPNGRGAANADSVCCRLAARYDLRMPFRVGLGTDRHRLADGTGFRLGGIDVACDRSVVAHSDGDVLLHALCDAILGAAGRGDIGDRFPPSDPQWKDADSALFVERTLADVRTQYRLVNVDATVSLQSPKLGPLKEQIATSIARLCDLPEGDVNVKAKTGESVGPVGRGEAIEAAVVVLLERITGQAVSL